MRQLGNLLAERVDGHVCQVPDAPVDPAVATSLPIGACARLQDQAVVFSGEDDHSGLSARAAYSSRVQSVCRQYCQLQAVPGSQNHTV